MPKSLQFGASKHFIALHFRLLPDTDTQLQIQILWSSVFWPHLWLHLLFNFICWCCCCCFCCTPFPNSNLKWSQFLMSWQDTYFNTLLSAMWGCGCYGCGVQLKLKSMVQRVKTECQTAVGAGGGGAVFWVALSVEDVAARVQGLKYLCLFLDILDWSIYEISGIRVIFFWALSYAFFSGSTSSNVQDFQASVP